MPFFNRQNNEDLILAIQSAEMFQVEIVDFENKTHFFEVEAENEAEGIARDNLERLRAVAQREVYANGYDYKIKAEVVNMYFNTRYYERYTMPAGMYDALRITIGSGEGHNWWCVMYPSICISSAVETDKRVEDTFSQNQQEIVKGNEYQYKFKVVEIFEKIVSFFE